MTMTPHHTHEMMREHGRQQQQSCCGQHTVGNAALIEGKK